MTPLERRGISLVFQWIGRVCRGMTDLHAQGYSRIGHDFRRELCALVCNDGGWEVSVAGHDVYQNWGYSGGICSDCIVRQ